MKKSLLIIALFISVQSFAQQKLAFPFQGGNRVMMQFFKDSLVVSPEIKQVKATGLVIFKFSADEQGNIKNVVIYYADDVMLARPVIEALKKSSHKWIIPNNEKSHDFILSFSIGFTPSATDVASAKEGLYNFYQKHKPILSANQVPLDNVTLLPTVVVNYKID